MYQVQYSTSACLLEILWELLYPNYTVGLLYSIEFLF
jgi:hypothetical protein